VFNCLKETLRLVSYQSVTTNSHNEPELNSQRTETVTEQ